jgi:Zn-finger nucleic acid-binding protein
MMTDRNGVEIDYCPECRGVWLDRGELDKIIERANQFSQAPPRTGHSDNKYEGHGDNRYKKKKDSFLDDLFDF